MSASNDWKQYWTPITERRKCLKDLGEGLKEPQTFHILGAGVAGLAAAIEILELPPVNGQRHTVRIYEGSGRVGGRINTKRLGPPPPEGEPDTRPYFERGAMRIPTSHDYTWAYAREAGLQRRRFLNDDRSHDFKGKVYRPIDLKTLAAAYRVRDPEAVEGPGHLYAKNVLRPELAELDRAYGNREIWAKLLLDGKMIGTRLEHIDKSSLTRVLRDNLQETDPGQIPFLIDLNFAGLEDRSFAMFVRFWLVNQGAPYELCQELGNLEIAGGMDLLVKGMQRRVEEIDRKAIELRRVVTKLDVSRGRWVVDFEQGPGISWRSNHHLLCTLPFSILRHEDVTLQGFPDDKMKAIRELSYADACKVALHVKERFWEQTSKDKGGRSLADTKVRSTYYPNDHNAVEPIPEREQQHAPYDLYSEPVETLNAEQKAALATLDQRPGPWLMLSSYTFGQHARRLGCEKPEETIADVRRVFPEVDDFVVDGPDSQSETWYWNKHRWARGPFALPLPGHLGSYYQAGLRPDAGVYFAGDHLSAVPGWIQGSLFSSLWSLEQQLRAATGQQAETEPVASGPVSS